MRRELFVTLNPLREPDPFRPCPIAYDHPLFDVSGPASANRALVVAGRELTWFCGSAFRRGLHEDGLCGSPSPTGGGTVPDRRVNDSARIHRSTPLHILRPDAREAAE